MEDHIEGLGSSQGLALIEQCAWPGANPWIGSQVGCGRDQIGQHKLGPVVVLKDVHGARRVRASLAPEKSRSTGDKHLHRVKVTIVVGP